MYLVIETKNNEHEFLHFINLDEKEITSEIKSLINHLNYFKNQEVIKVYYSKDKLTNW